MGKKRFYITTPIYYPSAKLHIGHAYCTTMCDIFKRSKVERGYECYFLTGDDEHGLKIEKNATAQGKDPQQFVDEISESFKQLWSKLKISNDDFIRTTQERHVTTVQKIFTKLMENDDIYLGKYKGWYCKECEAFWTDTQAGPEHLCPDCHRPVEIAEEEAYFFKTSKYVDRLLKFYDDNPKFLLPESRKNEMINTFIKPGLEDLCVSRTSFTWGIPIRENPKHVIYVWLDALSNYISALGYLSDDDSLYKKYWEDEDCEIIHVLGADITRFHAIYWPMFLMSLGERLPDREFVHGLLMMKDSKMSKSKGNVIDPLFLIDRYGSDCVRYYLAREVNFGSDGSFTPEQFVERINTDLVNSFGNLLNRTIGMINKYFDGVIPEYKGSNTTLEKEIESLVNETIDKYEAAMDDLRLTEGVVLVNELVNRGNKYIDETKPWEVAKEGNIDALASVMSHLVNVLYTAGILYHPVIMDSCDSLFDQLNIPQDHRNYDYIHDFGCIGGQKVGESKPLFPRLDPAVEIDAIKKANGILD
ncbi:MAG: methionine--tRNA ligase [Coprobacillus sp.]|nr:methionine--tRNA ligase [Coprobacillus sp.]